MLRAATLSLILLLLAPSPGTECVGLSRPVEGPIVAVFAPIGRYGGHWGVDIETEPGSRVGAAAAGRVRFVGTVVGNRAVTVDHGGGVLTTVSYLGSTNVEAGSRVVRGGLLGFSGVDHGGPVVHFSVRLAGEYVDPLPLLGCVPVTPGNALRLVP